MIFLINYGVAPQRLKNTAIEHVRNWMVLLSASSVLCMTFTVNLRSSASLPFFFFNILQRYEFYCNHRMENKSLNPLCRSAETRGFSHNTVQCSTLVYDCETSTPEWETLLSETRYAIIHTQLTSWPASNLDVRLSDFIGFYNYWIRINN